MWKNTNHLLYQKDILRLKSNRMPSECVILVFPHFNNRRLKVLWECGKVELFSRLFQVLWEGVGKSGRFSRIFPCLSTIRHFHKTCYHSVICHTKENISMARRGRENFHNEICPLLIKPEAYLLYL